MVSVAAEFCDDNPMLWASLGGVVMLQAIAVHWQPAQAIVGTSSMTMGDWAIAIGVAASILVLEESRKLSERLRERLFQRI